MPHTALPPLSSSFTKKKAQILSAISVPLDTYTDKSPKGSIDAPIIDLIDELNGLQGVVTTSSCSGRVAVYVEGPRSEIDADVEGEGEVLTGSPAGKGGGKWLFVSHDPVQLPARGEKHDSWYRDLCGLSCATPSSSDAVAGDGEVTSKRLPRLIKLSFSPLILHVLTASLHHARPLLTAAINAGFRESGVQSLKALDDADAGVMLGIRTMGLSFETVIGIVKEVKLSSESHGTGTGSVEGSQEVYEAVVSEEFLETMFAIVNERFEWNVKRKERLRGQVGRLFGGHGKGQWESKEDRAKRKREEGLKRQRETERSSEGTETTSTDNRDTDVTEIGSADMFDEAPNDKI